MRVMIRSVVAITCAIGLVSAHGSARAKGNGAAGSTNGRKTSDAKLIAAYTYMSETGEPSLRVLRYEPKTFKQQKWDGRSWRWGKPDGPKSLQLAGGREGRDRLRLRGRTGLRSPTRTRPCRNHGLRRRGQVGAGSCPVDLQGQAVFIIADKDEPGRAHAQNVAWSLYSITESVRVVELPEGKDVSEWLDGGGDPPPLWRFVKGSRSGNTIRQRRPRPQPKTKVPSEIAFIDVETIQPVPVTWVWPRRVARGKLALLAGDPGLGKSQIVLDIIARITTGAPWPDDGHAPRGRCIILTAEDAISDTIPSAA